MTGNELRVIRKNLGLSMASFATAVGYTGSNAVRQVAMSRYERDARGIPPWIARLATMYDRFGVPEDLG